MTEPFFTVGHSNRTLEDFIGLIHDCEIALVVDVRKLPGSTKYPQFNEETLAAALRSVGIGFRRAEGLTGRRPVNREVPFEVNAWWQNRSFHNYADHALSDEFAHSLSKLRDWGHTERLAVMCSEAVWWRCHRRIIADHLLIQGEDVRHILAANHVNAAQLSSGAMLEENLTVKYPKTVTRP